ncbi:MAG TPA: hypothetical protein VEH82_03140 [Acidimicrobiales bacterium]|nr:hypothetical protein [Acidimicrobiales bacterium]
MNGPLPITKILPVEEGTHEGLLDDVLGIRRVPRDPVGHVEDRFHVAFEEVDQPPLSLDEADVAGRHHHIMNPSVRGPDLTPAQRGTEERREHAQVEQAGGQREHTDDYHHDPSDAPEGDTEHDERPSGDDARCPTSSACHEPSESHG